MKIQIEKKLALGLLAHIKDLSENLFDHSTRTYGWCNFCYWPATNHSKNCKAKQFIQAMEKICDESNQRKPL